MFLAVWRLSLVDVVGVVLGLVGPGGCPWWGSVSLLLLGGVSRPRGSASPR